MFILNSTSYSLDSVTYAKTNLRVPLITNLTTLKPCKNTAPDFYKNPYLQRGIYAEIKPIPILLSIQSPEPSFIISNRDVRSYRLDKKELGVTLWYGQPHTIECQTAVYYTSSQKAFDTADEIVSYVEKLLSFANSFARGSKGLMAIIIKDKDEQIIRETLQNLCGEYSKGLTVSIGSEHAYRQVDFDSPLGNKIKILAAYLNRGYGCADKGKQINNFLSSIFVDEKGHLFLQGLILETWKRSEVLQNFTSWHIF